MGLEVIYAALGVPSDSVIQLTDVWVGAWGRDVVLEGVCGAVRFALVFDDCREMRWRVYAHDNDGTPTALVDFAAGRDQHRSPAQVLAETFGLTVWYGALVVQQVT